MPSEASRVRVQVVLRDRISISPDCRAVNRCCALSGTHFTFLASPNTAAAMARQISTSSPDHSPLDSACEKPASPTFTPQMTWPRSLIVSNVLPACAGKTMRAATAITPPARIRFTCLSILILLIKNCNAYGRIAPRAAAARKGAGNVHPSSQVHQRNNPQHGRPAETARQEMGGAHRARASAVWLAADIVTHLVRGEAHLIAHQRAHRHFERDTFGRNRSLKPVAVERLNFAIHHEARDDQINV